MPRCIRVPLGCPLSDEPNPEDQVNSASASTAAQSDCTAPTERLVDNSAHVVRSLVTAILGHSSIVRLGLPESSTIHASLDAIEYAAGQIAALIRPVSLCPDAVPSTAAVRSGRGECVLVADDCDLVTALIVAQLQAAGFSPIECASGPSAIQAFAANSERIYAMVIDVNLPGLSGPECLREIRGTAPGLPAFLITGGESPSLDSIDTRTEVVQKPFAIADLIQRVSKRVSEYSVGRGGR